MRNVVILDYDMTLVDTLQIFYRVYNQLLKKYFGEEVSFGKFFEMFCENSIDGYKEYPPVFWEEFKVLYKANGPEEIKPMPGLMDFLDTLKKMKVESYIVTGRGIDPEEVERELEMLGISGFSGRIKTLKNSSGQHPFDKTEEVRQLLAGNEVAKCVLFGDYIDDIMAAKSNRCIAVGVTYGCKSEDFFKKAGADYVVRDLREGRAILEKIFSQNLEK